MNRNILYITKNSEILEKVVLIFIFLLPLALCISILIADLFVTTISVISIFWFFSKKDYLNNLKKINRPLSIIIFFYLIVLLSLLFSNDISKSFLPSFFYFRYFLLAITYFYIINKFEYSIKLISISIFITLFAILIDSFYEYLQIKEFFNLSMESYRHELGTGFIITSFFDEEKKLGSYLIRLLPFAVSLIVFLEIKIKKNIKIEFFLIILIGLLIFLTSERTAFFLFIFFFIFALKIIQKKIIVSSVFVFLIFMIGLTQPNLSGKFVNATLFQLEILKSPSEKFKLKKLENFSFNKIKYLSDEHEKLIKSGIEIFKENPLIGSGIKTYHETCNDIKFKKNLDIECSTHPHNTYIQLLSDTGILGFLVVFFIFFYILYLNLKILIKKNIPDILKSYYILNLGILINLMPFIPSGSFFNNWINLMIYLPLGFWFYLFLKIKKKDLI